MPSDYIPIPEDVGLFDPGPEPLPAAYFSNKSLASLIFDAMNGDPPLSGWFSVMILLCASCNNKTKSSKYKIYNLSK